MSEFINTIEVLGDEATMDAIIERTITEFRDDMLTSVGAYAFYGCAALTVVDVPTVTNIGGDAFHGCTGLTQLNFPKVTSLSLGGNGIFHGCTSLNKVVFPELLGSAKGADYGQSLFNSCTSLHTVDFGKVTTFGGYNAYTGCKNLSCIVLRGPAVASFVSTAGFSSTPIASGSGYIYVPRALVDSYKTATNWSTYADQIRAIEDYEIQSITLNTTELKFTTSDSQTLTVTTVPAGRTVEWSSDNPVVARVENGVVTPVSDGTTTITAYSPLGESASCMVTVDAGLHQVLAGVVFNTGYLNNDGNIGSTAATSDTYTDKFNISGYAGKNIIVTLLDVKAAASNSRICYYTESKAFISCTQGVASGSNVTMASTVPTNAVYAAISINKSNGFSGIEITCDGTIIGGADY